MGDNNPLREWFPGMSGKLVADETIIERIALRPTRRGSWRSRSPA